MLPLSILDLSVVTSGTRPAAALRNSIDLARHADALGYVRYWLAEHHNLPGIASAATSVVIGYIAGGTKRIRVGAGGIMLPNHAPLVIAEQFGTLESLYPGRIDLALGRAPGGDQLTARALRRYLGSSGETFPQDLLELQSYFRPAAPGQSVRAVPGAGLNVPLYLLGSSDFSARLAAELGLPFAFASHFAPDYLQIALDIYRSEFQPSPALGKPHVMIGVGVYAADRDEEARRLFTSAQMATLNMIRGHPRALPPPLASMDGQWSAGERAAIEHRTEYSAVGSRSSVAKRLKELLEETAADEIIVTAQIFDHAARLHSFEIAAEILRSSTSPVSPLNER